MEMDLRIKVRDSNGTPVIELGGELDAYTCSRFREAVIEVIQNGHTNIIINMEDVEYIDSSGLGTLVGGLKRVSEQKGTIAIICASTQIKKVFEITGLERVFPIYHNEEDAVSEISHKAISP